MEKSDMPSPQDLGREWEKELVQLVGGRLVHGSGNRCYARGDLKNGGEIVWSAKHTIHRRSPVDLDVIEDARSMALGPHGTNFGAIDVIAYKMAGDTMRADLDLMNLLAWIREPPQIVAPTSQDNIRNTARTPPHLR
jgi:hypothetical protein